MKRNESPSRVSTVRHGLAFTLALLLALQPALAAGAQGVPAGSAAPAAQPDAPPEGPLMIAILDGEGALNNIRERTAREPIVQVQDKNHKPVAGALVLFSIRNMNGAGAGFDGGATDFRVLTDADGRAVAHGFLPNTTAGKYYLTITATIGPLTTFVILHQENVDPAAEKPAQQEQARTGSPHHFIPKNPITRGIVIGGVVVAGVLLGVLLTRGGSGTSITAGTGTVTHP